LGLETRVRAEGRSFVAHLASIGCGEVGGKTVAAARRAVSSRWLSSPPSELLLLSVAVGAGGGFVGRRAARAVRQAEAQRMKAGAARAKLGSWRH
jgi:hypothetical protein